VPRLCGVRVPWPQWGVPLAWVWNLVTAAALISLPFGDNNGLEAGEFPIWAKIPLFIAVAVITSFPFSLDVAVPEEQKLGRIASVNLCASVTLVNMVMVAGQPIFLISIAFIFPLFTAYPKIPFVSPLKTHPLPMPNIPKSEC